MKKELEVKKKPPKKLPKIKKTENKKEKEDTERGEKRANRWTEYPQPGNSPEADIICVPV